MMLSAVKHIPKLELHAHLNGSISPETMAKLLQLKSSDEGEAGPSRSLTRIADNDSRGNKQIFQMFALIHEISDSHEAVYTITQDVIHDFAADGVKYLELRTTPREVPSAAMTRRTYIDTVLKAMQDCRAQNADIIVRLIIAIDRTKSVDVAMETVDLALEYKATSGGDVLGIDLSGNPTVGDASRFIPALLKAKAGGLKLSIHLSEATGKNNETLNILRDVQPDRIGHGVFLLPEHGGTQEIVDLVTQNKVPIEICLTSNLKCQLVTSYNDHHFNYWKEAGHPCLICTDDKGVFDTSLSQEYVHAAEAFHLSTTDLWLMGLQAVDHIFDDRVKDHLRQIWMAGKPDAQ